MVLEVTIKWHFESIFKPIKSVTKFILSSNAAEKKGNYLKGDSAFGYIFIGSKELQIKSLLIVSHVFQMWTTAVIKWLVRFTFKPR